MRYPVGKFKPEASLSFAQREHLIGEIEEAPALLRNAVKGLSEAQLDTPYREGGWTVRQVAYHLADVDMNAFLRFKLALTEDEPTIKTYKQDRWAETIDAKSAPIELALKLVEAVHGRWVLLLRSMEAADFMCAFQHPERGRVTLEQNLALMAWHGRHHVGHITSLRERMGWK